MLFALLDVFRAPVVRNLFLLDILAASFIDRLTFFNLDLKAAEVDIIGAPDAETCLALERAVFETECSLLERIRCVTVHAAKLVCATVAVADYDIAKFGGRLSVHLLASASACVPFHIDIEDVAAVGDLDVLECDVLSEEVRSI